MPCQDWNAASIAISTRQQAFGLKNVKRGKVDI